MAYDGNLALLLGCWFALIALAAWDIGDYLKPPKAPDRRQEWLDKLNQDNDDDDTH